MLKAFLGRKGMLLLRDRRGGTAIEYGLICSCIIIAMMAALQNFAAVSIRTWGNISTQVNSNT